MYIADKNVRIKLITNGVNIRNENVCVCDSNPFLVNGSEDTLRVIVKDIPLSVHENVIIDELERKKCKIRCKIFYQKLRVDGNLTECLTGDRVLYIEPLSTPLPRSVMFAGVVNKPAMSKLTAKSITRPLDKPISEQKWTSQPRGLKRQTLNTIRKAIDQTMPHFGDDMRQISPCFPTKPEME